MNELSSEPFAIPVVLVGLLLFVDTLLKAALRRSAVPSVVVHLLIGFVLALGEWRWGLLGPMGGGVIDFLASVGIVFLLFRVGLESNVAKLVENLRGATFLWIANVSVSGALGFLVAYYALGIDLVPSLFVAVAMTATSLGVGVAVWKEEDALDSRRGQLLLDVSELDDISGIILMSVLFAVAPILQDGQTNSLALPVAEAVAQMLTRFALFALAVALFARFLEAPLTHLVTRLEPAPDRLITVVAVGLVVAAAAGALGFSLAIGAFFGGLAFSRDPEAVKLDSSFDPLYDFFTPFFFIAIGTRIDPGNLGAALPLGLALFVVAVLGKVVGAGAGGLAVLRPRDALLLGVSMVPRAEIAMVIMQYGMLLGAWAVSETLFAAMAVASLLTCLLAPLAIRSQLRRAARADPE